jgi:hypothetical protein
MYNNDQTNKLSNFKVITYAEEVKSNKGYYSHWSTGLHMLIKKNGVVLELDETELKQLVNSLPRTIGGCY